MPLLFVEDDAPIREVVMDGLVEYGFDVVEAVKAEDAIRLIEDGFRPPVVITDIDLGAGQSGIELADWLRVRWPDLGVIFVTGRLDRLRGRPAHPREATLAKPFRLAPLVALVRQFS